jgi:hypothetical protein
MTAISINENLQNMLYMVHTGSKISIDYAGNNITRNTSMVKYVIYNMGRVNKVCFKKITSCISFFCLICITKEHIQNSVLKLLLYYSGKETERL